MENGLHLPIIFGKRLWSLPVISAALFLIGTWVFFDMGETAFILYAAVYLVLGIAAMLAMSAFVAKNNFL